MKLSEIGLIRFHIKKLKQFDEITRFRLIVLGGINILFAFSYPIIVQYFYLLEIKINDIIIHAAAIIAIIGIFKTFGEKLVTKISDNFSFSKIFLTMVILDIFMAIGVGLFFISPRLMVWVDSIIGVIQLPFFIAYANSLNNYINYFYPKKLTNFQNYRADLNAETRLLGLVLASSITLISMKLSVALFVIGMLLLSFWQLKHYNMFKKYDFRYMYNYHKNRKGV